MCGISGIVHRKDQILNSTEALKAMTDRVAHRGPDGEGFYNDGVSVALGHRRLAILDVSPAGAQPMYFADKYVLVFNGEIYNYIELRAELKGLGYSFNSGSDSEVILAAYDCWGEDCVKRFNGMWGFAIHDKEKKRLFCSRDRFGVKPFYYHVSDTYFAFGSEIKQLIGLLPQRKINKPVFFDYLFTGYLNHRESTFFEGIQKLLPSHSLTYDLRSHSFSIKRYYDLVIDPTVRAMSEKDALVCYKGYLDDAIRIRLRSDVTVGTCLSGGLDSSYIAAIAGDLYKRESGKSFVAITAKSIEKSKDETAYAKMVVDKSDLHWIQTAPDQQHFYEVLDKVIALQEEPVGGPSIIMQYFVMQAARENGCVVMLDGQGGDETLLGYERYYTAYLNYLPLSKKLKKFRQIVHNSKLSLKDMLLYHLYFNNLAIRKQVLKNRYGFIHKHYFDYLNEGFLGEMQRYNKDLDAMQYFEITRDQLPSLLNYEDKNSMEHSIETRLPFLDYRAVECAYSIAHHHKIKNGWTKYILRKSASGILPDEIAWRKHKFGFEAPVNVWMSDKSNFRCKIKNSQLLSALMGMDRLDAINDTAVLWKLYNIAVWADQYEVVI